ncbi:DoxX family protein [Salinarchaeum laminariae]|uniref:DoxX family protein n=1 Tax=Salinarchaeum laminariae TaxID=869888 RepID=UPI0020BDB292|nr:DoxX family protein [Salinarchaeum laminariae]
MATDRKPAERTLEAELFGRDVTFDYSESWIAYSVVLLRVAMGWIFLQAGLEKWTANGIDGIQDQPLTGGFSAAGYLNNALHPDNPAQDLFAEMAGATWVDPLVVWGQILIGVALIVGILVRWSAFWGALMMLLFWLSHLQGGILAGLPVEHGWVVDETVVYVLLLFGLAAIGAGRIFGLDAKLEQSEIVQNNAWLRFLMG